MPIGYLAGYYISSEFLGDHGLKVSLAICPNTGLKYCWTENRSFLSSVICHEVGHAVWIRPYLYLDDFQNIFSAYIKEHPSIFAENFKKIYWEHYRDVYIDDDKIEEKILEEIFAESFSMWVLDRDFKVGNKIFKKLSPELKEVFQENIGGEMERLWMRGIYH